MSVDLRLIRPDSQKILVNELNQSLETITKQHPDIILKKLDKEGYSYDVALKQSGFTLDLYPDGTITLECHSPSANLMNNFAFLLFKLLKAEIHDPQIGKYLDIKTTTWLKEPTVEDRVAKLRTEKGEKAVSAAGYRTVIECQLYPLLPIPNENDRYQYLNTVIESSAKAVFSDYSYSTWFVQKDPGYRLFINNKSSFLSFSVSHVNFSSPKTHQRVDALDLTITGLIENGKEIKKFARLISKSYNAKISYKTITVNWEKDY